MKTKFTFILKGQKIRYIAHVVGDDVHVFWLTYDNFRSDAIIKKEAEHYIKTGFWTIVDEIDEIVED